MARRSRQRFDKGATGYLEVLVAENELFAAEIAAVGLMSARYARLVNVYQAMGGGWVDLAGAMTPKASADVCVHALAARLNRFTSGARPR